MNLKPANNVENKNPFPSSKWCFQSDSYSSSWVEIFPSWEWCFQLCFELDNCVSKWIVFRSELCFKIIKFDTQLEPSHSTWKYLNSYVVLFSTLFTRFLDNYDDSKFKVMSLSKKRSFQDCICFQVDNHVSKLECFQFLFLTWPLLDFKLWVRNKNLTQ